MRKNVHLKIVKEGVLQEKNTKIAKFLSEMAGIGVLEMLSMENIQIIMKKR